MEKAKQHELRMEFTFFENPQEVILKSKKANDVTDGLSYVILTSYRVLKL